jgi:hypothetical protein
MLVLRQHLVASPGCKLLSEVSARSARLDRLAFTLSLRITMYIVNGAPVSPLDMLEYVLYRLLAVFQALGPIFIPFVW